MRQGVASGTAAMVTAYRARAAARSDALFADPWAASLAGEVGFDLSRRFDALNPHTELWVAVRTAWLDRALERLVKRGRIGQVVILGAGFDTRAARLARPGVSFFEVDATSTQAEKLERLAACGDYPMEAARYVACDFERDDFLERLAGVGFSADVPAVFIWEGVSYYLSEAAVRATLRRIAERCHARTTVLFDYVGKRLVQGATKNATDREVMSLLSDLGEPFRFGVDHVVPLLYEEGFRHVDVVSFDEACLNLTGTYARERAFRFQYLAQASRRDPEAP